MDGMKKGNVVRKFERKYESGIFVGSDGTDFEESEGIIEGDGKGEKGVDVGKSQAWKGQLTVKERDWQDVLVEDVVGRCLEEGNESIDLS